MGCLEPRVIRMQTFDTKNWISVLSTESRLGQGLCSKFMIAWDGDLRIVF